MSNTTGTGSYLVQLEEDANETMESYLLRTRGPKHLSLNIVVPITAIYVFIFVTGVIGNIAVCVVIVRNNFMHTATNYYLFSLAVSDLTLLLLGLPNDLSVYWQQYPWPLGEVLCKFRALVSEMTSYTSVLTIVAFSMERYLAICHPLHSYAMSGLKRAVRIIAVVWVFSFLAALPFAMFTTVDYVDFPPGSGYPLYESAFCAMLDKNVPTGVPIYELSSLLFFLVPMVIIIILYVLIGLQIRQSSRHSLGKQMQGAVHGETKQIQSKRSIVRMLAAVVIAFFLCWAPFHAQRLLYLYAKDAPYYPQVNELLYTIAGCFYYFSSTVNPILYNLMSMKYRRAFRETLCGYSGQRRNRMSRDLQSSFRDTTVPLNTMTSTTEFRKSVHRSTRHLQQEDYSTAGPVPTITATASANAATQDDERSSSAADVLVMISPANGNAQCYKTLLRVTVGSKQAASKNSNSYEAQTAPSPHCNEIETCI
ncbi:neuropeptides capa receptor [Sipha flava]|uniref:Neuropeptide capa receptor n=1 Tax=Sipha flava TaxID=143950 RepID=A0A2S2PZF7_9HEMI|nr:neuropeptides capa receptor [Sipha flava]XP_025410934.1 neuropeptides capa receptor [Sipha flava]XP_025410936.1 neuropeptides capa receptor [Sipha flava]XP_025410937.1 neuropeptides capa receptor [Sipha flava]XP_025410938.1 neuropeptides capa receptor [Sipha flava]XP_025410939.1 neuropeptides capa receptor [Sipha flava]